MGVSFVAESLMRSPSPSAGESEGTGINIEHGVSILQPPAMAKIIRNGSLPSVTEDGSGSSGDTWERSCSHAKK
jgi:hypothetical protein